jgi:hypothetical protein
MEDDSISDTRGYSLSAQELHHIFVTDILGKVQAYYPVRETGRQHEQTEDALVLPTIKRPPT